MLKPENYQVHDITAEEWRDVVFVNFGEKVRIKNPVHLITRKGGKTHRVTTLDGRVYCYPAPETGLTYLVWKPRDLNNPVQF